MRSGERATDTWARAGGLARMRLLALVAVSLVAAGDSGGVFAAKWVTPAGDESVVRISYHPAKQGEGRISLQLGPEGERFVGQYLRLDGKRPAAQVEALYDVWSSEAFDDYGVGPSGAPWRRVEFNLDAFRKRYSGAVVATLAGDRGSSMRCGFKLEDAKRGLPGGASGECQASSGDRVSLPEKQTP